MRIPSPTIRQRADFSSINEMPDLPATGMPRGLTRAGRRTPSGNLARMACGDLPGPGTIARHGCGVAVAAPIGVLRGAFKIAMIPLKTVLGAVVGCIGGAGGGVALAANYSDSATPGCLPVTAGVTLGCIGGTVAGIAAGSVGELLDVPRVAFGEESLARETYRSISDS